MAALGEMWGDWVRSIFASLTGQDDNLALTDRQYSPRRGERYEPQCSVQQSFAHHEQAGAPISVYESFAENPHSSGRRQYESESFAGGGGYPTGLRSFAERRDGPEYNSMGVDHPSSQMYQRDFTPRDSFMGPCGGYSSSPFGDVHIPFKDGSSQILMRPKFGPQGLETPDLQQNLQGGSFLRSDAYKKREDQFFISDPEDIVDVQVAKFFEANPDIYIKTRLTRMRPGMYSMFGRQIAVEWVEGRRGKGALMVKDGPMQQPFGDYLDAKDTTAQYNGSVFKAKNNLQAIPQECRMTFNDAGYDYNRIDAMKVAKEQAIVREVAATVQIKQGQAPHMDRLMMRYEQNMDRKLGKGECKGNGKGKMPPQGFWGSPMPGTVRITPPGSQHSSGSRRPAPR